MAKKRLPHTPAQFMLAFLPLLSNCIEADNVKPRNWPQVDRDKLALLMGAWYGYEARMKRRRAVRRKAVRQRAQRARA